MTRRVASRARLLWAAVLILSSIDAARGAVFFVVNANDAGPGSLRQAILESNAASGGDSIAFQIPGPGPHTIAPLSQLPDISDPLFVDGTTQPGYSSNNRIVISGASAVSCCGVDGLVITGGNSTVRGLVINGFQPAFLGGRGNGIVLQGNGGNVLLDNRIGTDRSGTLASGNRANGVLISDSANNRVGATAAGELGNLISGNGTGVRIIGPNSGSNVVAGNFIGTHRGGTSALGNVGDGVVVLGGSGNSILSAAIVQVISGNGGNGITIGGSATSTFVAGNRVGTDVTGSVDVGNGSDGVEIAGSSFNQVGLGNLISGNDANGILLIAGASNNAVSGNFVGTDVSGMARLGNLVNGVIVSGANGNRIGGPGTGEGNLISGNGTNGVRIRSGASGNTVRGNRIGPNHAGTSVLANLEHGVQINDGATNNVVGGPTAAESNVISGNFLDGVFVNDAASTGNSILGNRIDGNVLNGVTVQAATENRILGNSVVGNGQMGIDLGRDLVTGNDPLDGDTGANLLQNFPVVTRATGSGGLTQVQGTLHSAAQTAYHLEFFSSPECDPRGHGEGALFLGSISVTTDAGGDAAFAASLPLGTPLGHVVTATATDPGGNTSEFSACAAVSASFYTVTPCRLIDTRDPGGSALAAGESRPFAAGGACGLPSAPRALAINVTAVGATASGHLSVVPAGAGAAVSTLNYNAGQTRANNAIVTLEPGGQFAVSCAQPGGTVHLLVDVTGYFE